jgi:phosphoribosyl 1,2-cyclic phosphodiesterase
MIMSLEVASLNSGSNGNAYYIGNTNEAVLIDAGISCSEIENRMARLGLDIGKLKAIFITHEHSDHISGLPRLLKKYQLPVYITEGTYRHSQLHVKRHLVNSFLPMVPVLIGDLQVTAFPKMHDAADPHSFIVSADSITVGVFTDFGKACDNIIGHFRRCHAAFLESNYDEERLINGSYPKILKNRIKSDKGHFSNHQALELFTNHRSDYLSHLFLSHLSQENNSPEIVESLFSTYAGNTKIFLASREKESAVFRIERDLIYAEGTQRPWIRKGQVQLSLF